VINIQFNSLWHAEECVEVHLAGVIAERIDAQRCIVVCAGSLRPPASFEKAASVTPSRAKRIQKSIEPDVTSRAGSSGITACAPPTSRIADPSTSGSSTPRAVTIRGRVGVAGGVADRGVRIEAGAPARG
jgi:hypothetical protein